MRTLTPEVQSRRLNAWSLGEDQILGTPDDVRRRGRHGADDDIRSNS